MATPLPLAQAAPGPSVTSEHGVGVPQPQPFWGAAALGFDHSHAVVQAGVHEEAARAAGWRDAKATQGAEASPIEGLLKRGWADIAGGVASGVGAAIRGYGAASDYYTSLWTGRDVTDAQRLVAPAADMFGQAQRNYAASVPNPNVIDKLFGVLGAIAPLAAAPEAAPAYFAAGGTGQFAEDAAIRHVALTPFDKAMGLASGAVQGGLALAPVGKLAEALVPELGSAAATGAVRFGAGTAASAGVGAAMQLGTNAAEKASIDPGRDLTAGVGESALMMGAFHGLSSAAGAVLARRGASATPEAEVLPAVAPEPLGASTAPIPPEEAADATRGAAQALDVIGQDHQAVGLQRAGGDYEAATASLQRAEPPEPPEPAQDVTGLFDGVQDDQQVDYPPPAPGAALLDRQSYRGRDVYAATFDPRAVSTAPELFQYKAGGDAAGVTDRLRGVQSWDPVSAGRAMVWEGPEGLLVADGHQRLGLAQRLDVDQMDGLLFRAADGWSAGDVRTLAALKNIREGSGTPLDAAKVFRGADAGLNDDSLPVTGEFMDQARGLARLSDKAFGSVVNKVVAERHAALIGNMAGDRPDLHAGMVDLLHRGRPANMDEARALVGESLEQDWIKREGAQADMFGGLPDQSSVIARAKVKASVLRQLRDDQRTFALLTRKADAIEAGGNALARDANEAALAINRAAEALVSKLAMRDGEVGAAMRAAVEEVNGGARPAEAARRVADLVRRSAAEGDLRDVRLTPEPPRPAAEARAAGFDEPGGRGQAEQVRAKPEEAALEQDRQRSAFISRELDKGIHEFEFTAANGSVVDGVLTLHDGGKLEIDINGTGGWGTHGDGAGRLGVRGVRQLLNHIREAYPDTTELMGLRTTGARPGEALASVKLPPRGAAEKLAGSEGQMAPAAADAPGAAPQAEVQQGVEGSSKREIGELGAAAPPGLFDDIRAEPNTAREAATRLAPCAPGGGE